MIQINNVEELIKSADVSHILNIGLNKNLKYTKDFIQRVKILEKRLIEDNKESEVKKLLEEKLQLKQKYKQEFYLQNAIETAINIYFAEKFDDFLYEAGNPNNKKDVDCKIKRNNCIYNIEIKSPTFEELRNNKDKNIKVQLGHRFDDFDYIKNKVKEFKDNAKGLEILTPFDDEKTGILLGQKENKLKQYLQETQEKIGIKNQDENIVNILIVCLDIPYDFDNWYHYLYDNKGIFTKDTFVDKRTYEEVDIVVFSNSTNYHRNYEDERFSAWNFEEHFSLCFINPLRRLEKIDGIINFVENVIPNYTKEYEKFMNEWYQKMGIEVLEKYIENAKLEIKNKYRTIKNYPYSHFRFLYFELFKHNIDEKIKFDDRYNHYARLKTLLEITTFIRYIEKLKGKIFIDENYYERRQL